MTEERPRNARTHFVSEDQFGNEPRCLSFCPEKKYVLLYSKPTILLAIVARPRRNALEKRGL